MSAGEGAQGGYAVPTYQLEGDVWYHFLHGNVPGHEIDFIYRAEVPQPPLTRQHFAHLTRLLRYIEPQSHESFAFAIGNLSRDDTQHEPGHGGLALVFMLRIQGATDHAGRREPPFAHAIAAVDRELDEVALIQTAVAFQKHILVDREAEAWYRHYVRLAGGAPDVMRGMCETYLSHFADLPQSDPSGLRVAWITRGVHVPKRVVLVHDDEVSFGEIAVAAARVAAVLFRSDIRWTAISNGREDDIAGGVSVRLVARSHVSPADAAGVLHDLHDLPDDEEGLAQKLFGATPAEARGDEPSRGWRERFAEKSGERASVLVQEQPKRRSWEGGPPPRVPRPPDPDSIDVTLDLPPKPTPLRSEPPANGGREAMMDVPPALPFVPPPAPLPELPAAREPTPALVPVSAPRPTLDPEATPRSSKRALWLILGGFFLVLAVIIAVVASQRGAGSSVPVGPTASVAVTASVPVAASAAAAPVTAAPSTPIPSALPSASAAPAASSKPSASTPIKPLPAPKKRGGGVIFDDFPR